MPTLPIKDPRGRLVFCRFRSFFFVPARYPNHVRCQKIYCCTSFRASGTGISGKLPRNRNSTVSRALRQGIPIVEPQRKVIQKPAKSKKRTPKSKGRPAGPLQFPKGPILQTADQIQRIVLFDQTDTQIIPPAGPSRESIPTSTPTEIVDEEEDFLQLEGNEFPDLDTASTSD